MKGLGDSPVRWYILEKCGSLFLLRCLCITKRITIWHKATVRKGVNTPDSIPNGLRWEGGQSLFELNLWFIGCFMPSFIFTACLPKEWESSEYSAWPKVGTHALPKERKEWVRERERESETLSLSSKSPKFSVSLRRKQTAHNSKYDY